MRTATRWHQRGYTRQHRGDNLARSWYMQGSEAASPRQYPHGPEDTSHNSSTRWLSDSLTFSMITTALGIVPPRGARADYTFAAHAPSGSRSASQGLSYYRVIPPSIPAHAGHSEWL